MYIRLYTFRGATKDQGKHRRKEWQKNRLRKSPYKHTATVYTIRVYLQLWLLPTNNNECTCCALKKNQGDRQKNIKKPAVSLNVIQVTFETWNRLAAHVGAANSQNKNRKHNVSLVVMPAEKKKEEKSISDQNNYPIQANEKLFWHKSIFCLYLFDRCKIMFF